MDYQERVLARVTDLPAAPAIVGEVLRIAEDPSSGMHELSAVIERDPGMTAKLLRVSNSPYYGMRQNIGTLKLALVVLGLREVRNLILGISVIDAVRTDESEALLSRTFWVHSGKVAAVSRQLGLRLRMGLQGESFVGGLLHDVGKVALVRTFPDTYPDLLREAGGHGPALVAAEREAYGFNHAELAATLLNQWGFPAALVDAVRLHHGKGERDLDTAADPALSAVVRLANRTVRTNLGGPDEDLFTLPEDLAAARLLGKNPNFPDLLKGRDLLTEIASEVEQANTALF